jgi:PAS domain S-box-containing protein
LPVALVLIRQNGRIGVTNGRVERMFAYDPGSLDDRPFADLLPDRLRGECDLSSATRKNLALTERLGSRDVWGLRSNGIEFKLRIDFQSLDVDGEPMVLASLHDITAQSDNDLITLGKQQELDRSNADLDEFLYAASHDLKAPLRAISHLVQWIGEDVEATATPATIENLALLRGRVARLQLLLEGLLHYSHLSGGPPVVVEPVNIAELVREVATLLAPPPGFVIACEGDMPILVTHRAPLMSVLENLISNGFKHHDRQQGRIAVSMRLEDGVAEFRVSDDGPGIPPQFHDKVFAIFQTLASRDDVEAGGIGLAIVKRRVQGHGGRVWIESAPPQRGSTFVFTWPAVAR